MRKDDFVYKELKTQENRLKYIESLLAGKVDCNFYPRRVFIEPTNRCNCRCIHCPGARHMTRPRGFMEWDLYVKIIDELGPLWPYITVNLYQHGEPLLHPRIYDMVDYAQDRNLFVKMNTNLGALKKKDIPRLINANYLEISVDAASPRTYREVKGNDRFERVLENLLDFLEAWGELTTSAHYACDVSFLTQGINHREADIFEEMFSRLPIGHVNVFRIHNFTGAISEGNTSIPEQSGRIPRAQWPCCNTPWDIMGVNWDGRAVACVYDYDSRYVIGDVRRMSLLECWNSEPMQEFRRGLLDRNYEHIEKNGNLCSQCSIMWLEDYSIPTDFHKEVLRIEKYMSTAVHRVGDQHARHEKILEKWKYLKENRKAWKEELYARTRALTPSSSGDK